MVLLSNDGVLPLVVTSLNRIAVIGPHAIAPSAMGGGSAQVTPYRMTTPLEALSAHCGSDVEIVFERGCEVSSAPAVVGEAVLRAPDGFLGERFAGTEFEGPSVETLEMSGLRMVSFGGLAPERVTGDWSMRVAGVVIPQESGTFQLALAQAGSARLFVNGELLLDGFTNPPPQGGSDFFGQASQDLVADVPLERDAAVELMVEFVRTGLALSGFRVGFRTTDQDALLERAVAAASDADVAIVCIGTTGETESEGHDRKDLNLPGRQEELIRRVAAVNDRTVVVVNAGAPIDMSWADDVASVLQCWFGGQEMGGALADVLIGEAEPGGRLPTTIPFRLEHSPSHANFPGENGELRYGEGVFMGYRGYEHGDRLPRFPFGHGLSYTTCEIGEPTLSAAALLPAAPITVSVPVVNTGARGGSEVVQAYVAPESNSTGPPAQGAQSLRQGLAGARGDEDGGPGARCSLLRLLGSRSGRLGRDHVDVTGHVQRGDAGCGAQDTGLAGRCWMLRRSHRPLVPRHRGQLPCRSSCRRRWAIVKMKHSGQWPRVRG